MPFDPFLSRPRASKPHLVDSITNECIMCGCGWWEVWDSPECDPNSVKAQEYRKTKQDAAVGRIVTRGHG